MNEDAVECKGCGNVYPVSQDKCQYCGRVNPGRIVGDPKVAAAAGTDSIGDSFNRLKETVGNTCKTVIKEGTDLIQSATRSFQHSVSQPAPPPSSSLDEIYPKPPEPRARYKEKVSVFVCILSFFIPFFGLIYFLTMKRKKKKTAFIALILFLINFICLVINANAVG